MPTIFSCQLPSGGWINLAQVRQLEPDPPTGKVVVTWLNGEKQLFDGENAKAILQGWQDANQKCRCHDQQNNENDY
ncbi:hypothetical protein ACQFX9_25880 [Aliinostoc sp. HNIBRCY26]|uniref:hypothetical protein n=1 Tax=Aliinostoc sp. HNIBRCY26 TaxID=3418997 RepID=UPI003D01AD7C